MVGSTEDVEPTDAPKVAAAVFGAVGVYAVRTLSFLSPFYLIRLAES